LKYKLWKEDPDFKNKWLLYIPQNRSEATWLKDIHRLGKEYRPDIDVSSDPAAQYLVTRTENIPDEFADEWTSNDEVRFKAFFTVLFKENHYDPRSFIIEFLSKPDNYIRILDNYDQENDWKTLLKSEYGIDAGYNSLELAKKIIFSELHHNSPIDKYKRLTADKIEKTAELCRHWQNNDPHKYRRYIKAIEKEYDIEKTVKESDSFQWKSTAFSGVDKGLLKLCTSKLLDLSIDEMHNIVDELKPIVEDRKKSFWYKEGYCDYWEVIEYGFEVVKGSSDATKELSKFEDTIDGLIQKYLNDWCEIDSNYRKYVNAHRDLMYPIPDLEEVGRRFTNSYTRFTKEINRIFTEKIQNQPYIGDLQCDFFTNISSSNGTAIIICDALRYELAKDIESRISENDNITNLTVLSSTIPSMTQYGMAALLPGKLSYELTNDITVKVDGKTIKNKSDRIDILEKEGFMVDEIHSILNEPIKSINKKGNPPRVIYTRLIDEMGETLDKDEHQVLANITNHVKDVEKLIRRLITIGYEEFYITSDHGFLYTEELPDELKVDPPSNNKLVKRRFAVLDDPNFESDNLITLNSKDLSKIKVDSSDMTIAFPYGVACFKSKGGNMRYFHGGISIQELALPLLTIKTEEKKMIGKEIDIEIDFPTKITNSIISINLTPKGQIPLGKGRTIILQARIGDKIVCEPKKVEVDTKKKVSLRLKTGSFGDASSVILEAIDEETQEILKEIRTPIDLIIKDDMGFDV